MLTAQDTRRFVLGFTLCGSLTRGWAFDRLGGIASQKFDVNQDAEQFVSMVLGFLWMSEEELGFDLIIISVEGRRYINVERNGRTERLIINERMKRAPCVAGRATICWRAHRDGDKMPLVIKDSWQYLDGGEGELLREATAKDVVNVARYYHHETVRVRGRDDDVQNNVRAGLDITEAANYRSENSIPPPISTAVSSQWRGRSTGRKRSSSYTDAPLPPSKRSCSTSPTKPRSTAVSNRVHRRIILRDFGKAIYKASSRAAFLAALEGCIEGHESLRTKAGILQRDISINNLMIDEDEENPSWRSFLIDLDLAIGEQRESASGARGKTGTRAFMAIGVLLASSTLSCTISSHSSGFLFWICIHYDGPDKSRVVPWFDK